MPVPKGVARPKLATRIATTATARRRLFFFIEISPRFCSIQRCEAREKTLTIVRLVPDSWGSLVSTAGAAMRDDESLSGALVDHHLSRRAVGKGEGDSSVARMWRGVPVSDQHFSGVTDHHHFRARVAGDRRMAEEVCSADSEGDRPARDGITLHHRGGRRRGRGGRRGSNVECEGESAHVARGVAHGSGGPVATNREGAACRDEPRGTDEKIRSTAGLYEGLGTEIRTDAQLLTERR